MFRVFVKYNLVSIIATLIDFSVFVILSKIILVWYVYAAAIGAVSGGITAFLLNRNWVFKNKKKLKYQIPKYLSVWGTSILLNTSGIYLLVESMKIDPIIAKIIIAILVGELFNFYMNKKFIFR